MTHVTPCDPCDPIDQLSKRHLYKIEFIKPWSLMDNHGHHGPCRDELTEVLADVGSEWALISTK